MGEQHDQTTASVGPIPLRFWWLKRLALGGLVVLLLLVLLRVWWGYEAKRRWDSLLASYRQAGEPVSLDDFDWLGSSALTPESQLLLDAGALVVDGHDGVAPNGLSQACRWREANPLTLNVLERWWDEQKVAWRTQARPRIEAMWGDHFSPSGGRRSMPNEVLEQYDVKMLLSETIECCLENDNVRSAFTFTRLRSAHNEAMGLRYGGIGLWASFEAPAYDVLPRMRFCGGSDDGDASSGLCIPFADGRDWIDELLDERGQSEAFWQAQLVERANLLLLPNGPGASLGPRLVYARPTGWPPLPRWACAPAKLVESVRVVDTLTRAARAARDGEPWEDVVQLIPSEEREAVAARQWWRGEIRVRSMRWERALRMDLRDHYDRLARRRLLAVAVALRAYQAEHGCYPEDLAALVPTYLPRIPDDPFVRGRRISYVPDGNPPRVYSVSFNLSDDQGDVSGGGAKRNAADITVHVFMNDE